MASHRYTRYLSDPELYSPLSDRERLVRIASTKQILEGSIFTSIIHPSEVVYENDPFKAVAIPPELLDLPPKVLDLLSKGLVLQPAILVYQL